MNRERRWFHGLEGGGGGSLKADNECSVKEQVVDSGVLLGWNVCYMCGVSLCGIRPTRAGNNRTEASGKTRKGGQGKEAPEGQVQAEDGG